MCRLLAAFPCQPKAFDEEAGRVYYFNRVTGESRWDKPKGLGGTDLELTPRSRTLAPPRPPRYHASDLSNEEAAVRMQACARMFLARLHVVQLIRDRFEKLHDQCFGTTFYFDRVTLASSWTKPRLLRDADISWTPRSHAIVEAQQQAVRPPARTPRVRAADLDQGRAATIVQSAFRMYVARKAVLLLLCARFEKLYDPRTCAAFYFDKETEQTMWHKPKLFRSRDVPMTPRSHAMWAADIEGGHRRILTAEEMTEDQAATFIQTVARRFLAMRRAQEESARLWSKGFEPSSGLFYFFNHRTGESVWETPRLLVAEEMELTPRSTILRHKARVASGETPSEADMRAYRRARKQIPSPRVRAADLTDDAAATVVQCAARQRLARERMREACAARYSKGYDAASGTFFYFNVATGESSWDPPRVIGGDDLELTPRSTITLVKAKQAAGQDVAEEELEQYREARRLVPSPRWRAADLSPDQAAVILQCAVRQWAARRRVREKVRETFSMGFDPDSGCYFYYNVLTGESAWEPPGVLGADELELTPRSAIAFITAKKAAGDALTEAERDQLVQARRALAEPLTEQQAASLIQSVARMVLCRPRVERLLEKVYEKQYDGETEGAFWRNKRLQTTWHLQPPMVFGGYDLMYTPRSHKRQAEVALFGF